MQFESSIQISAPATTVFALYADVANWHTWDPEVKSASLQGAFASGVQGVIVPNGGPKSTITFSEVIPPRRFVASCKLPLCVMRFENDLQSHSGGNGNVTTATHRVFFEGLLAPLFGRLIGSGMRKTIPMALQGLRKAAEAKAVA
jgi:carbon monoxide dehydrogenase subunit G